MGVHLLALLLDDPCGGAKQCSVPEALSTHPYGSFGLCENYPRVITHSGAIPDLGLYEDMVSWPRGSWHQPGHVLDQGRGFLMGQRRSLLELCSELSLDGPMGE